MISNRFELNTNSNVDFIKKEEVITVKDEFDPCLQNEARPRINEVVCKYEETFDCFAEPTAKYMRETVYLEHKISYEDLPHSNRKQPSLLNPPSATPVVGDYGTCYNLIKLENMMDSSIKHPADLQHMDTWNVCRQQWNLKNCKVEDRLEQRNTVCYASSSLGTLAEGEPSTSGLYECISLKNEDMEKPTIVTRPGANLFKGAVREHSTIQKQNSEVCMKREYNACHVDIDFGEQQLKRGLCEYRPLEKATLLRHKRGKPYKCQICEYSASHKRSLVRHLRTHTGDKPHKCEICHYSSLEKFNLVRHLQSHTGKKPFKCQICNYDTSKKGNLVQHIRTHTGEKPFKCKICDYSASHKVSLMEHIRTHTGAEPFKCTVCDFSTLHKRSLIRHIRTHTGDKPFKCEICNYSAWEKGNLVQHCRTHSGQKPFKCAICDFCTSEKRNLVQHSRTHTGEKSFRCEFCNYSGSVKAQLVRHIRTHTGEKLFKCSLCDYSASHKISLVQHIRKHTACGN